MDTETDTDGQENRKQMCRSSNILHAYAPTYIHAYTPTYIRAYAATYICSTIHTSAHMQQHTSTHLTSSCILRQRHAPEVFTHVRTSTKHPVSREAGMGWLRLVGSLRLGRAAARRTAPKQPRVIRVGPHSGVHPPKCIIPGLIYQNA